MPNIGNTQQQIDYGASANDGTGDPLRTAFIKTDDNFDNIWLAGPVGSNITIVNNAIQVNNTNGNLILSPNGVGVVQTNSRLLPKLNNTYDLGSTALKYRAGYFGAGGLVVDGNVTVAGNLIAGNNLGVSGQLTVNSITSSDSAFVTVDDGLDVQGTITAESLLATSVTTEVLLFAALPAAAASQGLRAMITNANLVAVGNFGQPVTGGGANTVPVYSDGAVYRIG